jgi:hypothetical protein
LSISAIISDREIRFYVRNLFEVIPEGIFKAHARLVPVNDNGALEDLHNLPYATSRFA